MIELEPYFGLGKIIAFLEECDPNSICKLGFHNPHSYRGYYEDLCFEPAENVPVGIMLLAAKESLGKTFEGYKGGSFTMEDYTTCWLGYYGHSGGEVIGNVMLSFMTGKL
jgi:hypothetical protein